MREPSATVRRTYHTRGTQNPGISESFLARTSLEMRTRLKKIPVHCSCNQKQNQHVNRSLYSQHSTVHASLTRMVSNKFLTETDVRHILTAVKAKCVKHFWPYNIYCLSFLFLYLHNWCIFEWLWVEVGGWVHACRYKKEMDKNYKIKLK